MKLSKRLETIASFVKKEDNKVIDVGCDHALLSIFLAKKYENMQIIASDINQNPLKTALLNIKKYHLENQIKILENDGIKNLKDDIKTVIISGMGGILISNILKNGNLNNVETIILSPNNEYELVHKTIMSLNYKIEREIIIIDKNIPYLVIRATHGYEKIDPLFGKLLPNHLGSIYYFTKLYNTNKNIIKKIPKRYIIKKYKLNKSNKKIKNFLK